jgi:hypothetical protein
VESSCEFGIEPLGSIKCWETTECPNNWGPSLDKALDRDYALLSSFINFLFQNDQHKKFRGNHALLFIWQFFHDLTKCDTMLPLSHLTKCD